MVLLGGLFTSLDTRSDKRRDGNGEMRRAAAPACARKERWEHVPDRMTLREDPEPLAAQSAGAALKRLAARGTGKVASDNGG
jgi:hypothetical protein